MKAMYRKHAMNLYADACSAPAAQSAAMTMTSDGHALNLDTALLAVSFLSDVLRGAAALSVRIMPLHRANP